MSSDIQVGSIWREKHSVSHTRYGVEPQTFQVTGRRRDGRYQTTRISGSGKKRTSVTSGERILANCELVSPGRQVGGSQ